MPNGYGQDEERPVIIGKAAAAGAAGLGFVLGRDYDLSRGEVKDTVGI